MLFDDEFNDLFNGLWNRFSRPVLDQTYYRAYSVPGKGFIIVCNTLGISKDDISVKIEKRKGDAYPILKISGETKLEKINFQNKIDLGIKLKFDREIESVSYEVKDGLTIVYLKTKTEEPEKFEVKYADTSNTLDW